MSEFYEIEICGLKRHLPLTAVGKNTRLANFNILGDVELVVKASEVLAKRLKDFKFDYLVGPEVKVVPLIHELAKHLGHKRYIVCRKTINPYMVNPTVLKPLDYFPKHVNPLVIDGPDKKLISGKKVVIVDDVISTGVTIRMMKKLMEMVPTEVVATAAIIRQGEKQFDNIDNFIYLTTLPIFKSSEQQ